VTLSLVLPAVLGPSSGAVSENAFTMDPFAVNAPAATGPMVAGGGATSSNVKALEQAGHQVQTSIGATKPGEIAAKAADNIITQGKAYAIKALTAGGFSIVGGLVGGGGGGSGGGTIDTGTTQIAPTASQKFQKAKPWLYGGGAVLLVTVLGFAFKGRN
jgi:hypothetical protein